MTSFYQKPKISFPFPFITSLRIIPEQPITYSGNQRCLLKPRIHDTTPTTERTERLLENQHRAPLSTAKSNMPSTGMRKITQNLIKKICSSKQSVPIINLSLFAKTWSVWKRRAQGILGTCKMLSPLSFFGFEHFLLPNFHCLGSHTCSWVVFESLVLMFYTCITSMFEQPVSIKKWKYVLHSFIHQLWKTISQIPRLRNLK